MENKTIDGLVDYITGATWPGEAKKAVVAWAIEQLPEEKDEGPHKGHDCADEYCHTCDKGMNESDWYAYLNYLYNGAIQDMKANLRKAVNGK